MLSSNNIHTYHPGDPDLEWMNDPEARVMVARAVDVFRPEAEYHGAGQILFFGTAGDFDAVGGLEELFYGKSVPVEQAPDGKLIGYFTPQRQL